MQAHDLFVLDPTNRAFIEGRGQRTNPSRLLGCMVVFLVPFVLIGLFTIILAFQAWFRVIGFQGAGTTTQAEVVDRGVRTDSDDDDHPFLVLRYTVPEQGSVVLTERLDVSWEVYRAHEVGAMLAIDYITVSPTNLRVAGDSSNTLFAALFMTGFTAFWNLITWAFVGFIGNGIIKRRRLDQAGYLLRGELTSYATSYDSDGDLWVEVGYRFYTKEGTLIDATGKSIRNHLQGSEAPPVGVEVMVLYADKQTYELL